mmetsp:Transcript_23155/g.42593  ORF Transcript_23155/g.42593 Transcript_23155/m.42593 type:complete len:102 (-) Transcript_23155:1868-2173(-)
MVTAEYSVDSYSSNKFCRRSVKQLGKKSGKTRCIAPNIKTCPIGVKGIIRMIRTGINVIVSLNVRLNVRTSLGFNVYPCNALNIKLEQNKTSSENNLTPLT